VKQIEYLDEILEQDPVSIIRDIDSLEPKDQKNIKQLYRALILGDEVLSLIQTFSSKLKTFIRSDRKNLILFKPDCYQPNDSTHELCSFFSFSCQLTDNIEVVELMSPRIYEPVVANSSSNSIMKRIVRISTWLLNHSPNSQPNKAYIENFNLACKTGHFKTAKWIYEQSSSIDRKMMTVPNAAQALKLACKQGNVDIVEWLFERCDESSRQDLIKAAFIKSCKQGHFDIMKWLYQRCDESRRQDLIEAAFIESCEQGHLDTVKWLYEHCDDSRRQDLIEMTLNPNAIYIAYRDNHVETLQWLFEKYQGNQRDEILNFLCSKSNIKTLVQLGRVDHLKWLYQQSRANMRIDDKQPISSSHDRFIFDLLASAYRSAASVDYFKWLTQQCDNKELYKVALAITSGDLNNFSLKFFFEHVHESMIRELQKIINVSLSKPSGTFNFYKFASKDQRAIVEFLGKDAIKDWIESQFLSRKIQLGWEFDDKTKLLLKYGDESRLQERIEAENFGILHASCLKRDWDFAKWLVEQCDESRQQAILEIAFRRACSYRRGDLDFANWLLDQCDESRRQALLETNDFKAFRNVCSYGELNFAKYLFERCDESRRQAMLEANDFQVFNDRPIESCNEIWQWLCEICDESRRQAMLEANDFAAFRASCKYAANGAEKILYQWCDESRRQAMLEANHLEIFQKPHQYIFESRADKLKWLYERCDNSRFQAILEADNFAAFQILIPQERLDVAVYLHERCDESKRKDMLKSYSIEKCYYEACGHYEEGYRPPYARAGDFHLTHRYNGKRNDAAIWLFEKSDETGRQEQIEKKEFYMFRMLLEKGDLETAKRVLQQCKVTRRPAMLEAKGFEAFLSVCENQHIPKYLKMARWLLGFPSVRDFAAQSKNIRIKTIYQVYMDDMDKGLTAMAGTFFDKRPDPKTGLGRTGKDINSPANILDRDVMNHIASYVSNTWAKGAH